MAARLGGNSDIVDKIFRSEAFRKAVRKDVKRKGSREPHLAVHENIECQVHRRTDPVTHQQRPRVHQDRRQQYRHQFHRVKWQHEFSRTVREVIPKEADGTGPPPLLFEEQIIQIVIDVDQKPAKKGARRSFYGSGCIVRGRAERQRSGEVSSRHHTVWIIAR